MPEPPYRPSVKIGSLRQTTKKMMVQKVGGGKVGDNKLKNFLKEEKGMRRMAYGDKTQTVESWRGRHYIKDVKEKVASSEEYRTTLYGKKRTAAETFRDTVREEIHQEQGQQQGPTRDELDRQKRMEKAKQNLHQYERAREVEKESGKPMSSGGKDDHHDAAGGSGRPRAVPMVGGGGIGRASTAPVGATATMVAGGSGGAFVSSVADSEQPLFALRARVLRSLVDQRQLMVHVLNAPPELAVQIGRDLTVEVPEEVVCLKDQLRVKLEAIKISDHVDVRGRKLNGKYFAEEVYVNNTELPAFVQRLDALPKTDDELTTKPPVDLAIG